MKNNLKKMVSAVLLVTVTATGLTFISCGGDDKKNLLDDDYNKFEWVRSTTNTDEINVTAIKAGMGEDYLNAVAQAYEDETGIKVNVFFDPNLDVEQNMNINKNLDDLYLCGAVYSWIKWVSQDKVESLEDILDLPYIGEKASDGTEMTLRKKSKKDVLPLGRYKEEQWVLQLPYAPTGIVYNVDILKQLGYDKFPEKWSDLIELCNKINEAKITSPDNKTVKPISWGGAVYDLNSIFKTLWAQNSVDEYLEFFSYEETSGPSKDLWCSEGRLKAMEALYDLLIPGTDGFSKNSLSGLGGATNVDSEVAFLNGYSAFCPTGAWFETEVSSALSNANFEYGFAPVPALDGKEQVVDINIPTEYFYVPKKGSNPEGAKDFLRFMFAEENLKLMHKLSQTPLAYEYDTSGLNLSPWGQQTLDLIKNHKNVIAAQATDMYRVGALNVMYFASGDPYVGMATGKIKKEDIMSKVLDMEYKNKVDRWNDFVSLIPKN